MRRTRIIPRICAAAVAPSAVVALSIAGVFALAPPAAAQSKSVDIRAETMAGVAEVLAPYLNKPATDNAPVVNRALDALRKEKLLQPPVAHPVDDPTERLGRAMQLGTRTKQFLPELAKLNDALAQASDSALRAAIVDLQTKAGRTAPNGATLDKLVADARAAGGTSGPSQHVTIDRPDYQVRIDHSPSAGITKVDVITKGDDGKPERVSFGGTQGTTPKRDGSGLDTGLKPTPPRQITEADSDKMRLGLAGKWTDQDGYVWEIEVAGNALTITNTNNNRHRVVYKSELSLGHIHGVHLVDNVADMNDTLPGDVKEALASTYHPPFTIELDDQPEGNALRGMWISGQVTYSGMTHAIKIVEDPTWDSPLVLTRGIKVAQGGRWPEDGP